ESGALREHEERRWLARQLCGREAAGEASKERNESDEEKEEANNEEGDDGSNRPQDRAQPGRTRRAGQSNERTFGPTPRITAAARPTCSRSPKKNGVNPSSKAFAVFPLSRASCAKPPRWMTAMPRKQQTSTRRMPAPLRMPSPATAAAAGKAKRYPPVGPSTWANPPDPPANTGSPSMPSAR